jgi:hypothetical protein
MRAGFNRPDAIVNLDAQNTHADAGILAVQKPALSSS